MGRLTGQRRVAAVLLEVVLAGSIATGAAVLVDCLADPRWEPGLAVGVFGTFLTSMAIIAAFSIEEKSRWPTPWEILDRAHVPGWFLVALASVVVALAAAATDDAFLNALGLTLATVGLLLGARGLWGLFSLSSDRGRRTLIVDLLASSIRRSEPPAGNEDADLGEVDTEDHVPAWFLRAGSPQAPRGSGVSIDLVPSALRLYADRRDPDAIVGLVGEVHAAATQALGESGWGGPDEYLARVDTLLGVQRGMFEEVARRVLSGQLGDAAARGALAGAGEAAIDIAGRVRKAPRSYGPMVGRDAEVLATRHLTALCRLAGSTAAEADAESSLAAGGPEWSRLTALRTTCVNLQQAARWAIDPAPPGMKLPADHAWRSGLSSAESALVWLWSAAESPSGPYGVGLYALCEILTERKFLDSYWEGYDVFARIERRLSESLDGPTAGSSRATLERAGGLARASLELAATRLAATPRRGSRASTREPEDDRHVACNLFLAGGGYKPAGGDPIEDLAWLLTDRLSGSLWTMVHGQLRQLRDPIVQPPLRPLHLDPAACALAVSLRLTPLESGAGAKEHLPLREFVEKLPTPLLAQTAALAQGLTEVDGEEPEPSRGGRENALVAAAGFVRNLIPGSPPGLEGEVGAGAPAPDADPASWVAAQPASDYRGPEEFVEALGRIAAAKSAIQVDLIQCGTRWLEEWADLRSALDAELLAAALRGRARIRRIVLFEIPGDAERRTTRFHYRWTDALSTAVGCFVSPGASAGGSAPYRVRQLVLPFARPSVLAPADCVVLRGDGLGDPDAERASAFDATWALFDRDARDTARVASLVDLAGRGGPLGSL